MNRKTASTVLLLGILFLNGCGEKKKDIETPKKSETLSLKEAFSEDFLIGVAINNRVIEETDTLAVGLVAREFNSISPENVMKWGELHPAPDVYHFDLSDKYVAFGEKKNMHIIGHTLLWHSQIGSWMNEVKDSAVMSSYIENHINAVAGRYKGRIYGWDVLNEALNEDGSLRESIFLKVMGEDYIERAFSLAAKADPKAELYYNDYNMWKPEKRAGAIKLIKKLQTKGARIDGVGMQAHWSLSGPSLEDIEQSIIAYAELGLKVMITELDITVLPNPWDLEGAEISQNFEGSEIMNPFPNQLPDSVQIQLAERYENIFRLFLKHKAKIDRVTFWGVNDKVSWLNNWPIKGRTNYPLPFDRAFEPKKAYERILRLKK
ncbi:endo-1,4-beta-xylanase [Kriegella aquimaris]|uniref:Beta-xylanase n=1 Tax=Kriegella aquimaris TaxID=192904 RepID=A0A1G9S549_9FLAO|nr:endo-1,4-beta-xylanase [Kriegella aquimaris]SDM30410.1 endo-1,4-beta-xylanase [Kriegella aquimaris]